MKLHYVLPVHNEAAILERNVERLAARLQSIPAADILLVENGSRDDSFAIAQRLAAGERRVPVRAFSEPMAGIGHGYHRGLRELAAAGSDGYAVLTAADLPFGFRDLDQVLAHPQAVTSPTFIGSKAHPESRIDTAPVRKLATRAFRLTRRAILGMRTGDPQGSIFVPVPEAARILDDIRARDFFYTTELVYLLERRGHPIIELPVENEREQRPSTVRPLKDGSRMLLSVLDLRWRMR